MATKLALEGGPRAVPADLGAHDWERYRKATEEEIDAVVSVLRSGHLSIAMPAGMPQSEALEEEFADWTGAKHCVAVNSGTAALHCAVAGVGVQAGDHVLVPAETFVASAMAVLHQNGIPIFVDIDPKTHLIDPAKIEEKITEYTKAIMVVHLYGLPGDMGAINDIARRHDLRVIEDAAQCYGGIYDGKKSGSLGDAAGFAMTTTKQLMVGEGGLLTTDSGEVYERAMMTRLFGETGGMTAPDRAYMSEAIGWNYKLTEVNSALARVRIRNLDDYIQGVRERAEYLTGRLTSIDGLETPGVPPKRTHTYYMYSLDVDPEPMGLDVEVGRLRNAVVKALKAENVDVSLWQKVPVPAQPMFQNKLAYGNGSPWNVPGGDVKYDIDEFPNAFAALERSFVVRRVVPPNGFDLMDCYADAFEKVFSQIERVVEIYEQSETYVPLKERQAYLKTGKV